MKPQELSPQLTDRNFEIVVRRLADDLQYGQDASCFLGAGVDYVQSRPFVEGDSVREIDWPVTGRTGRYHVKQYESLKRMVMYLVVDTSASMSFSSQRLSKHAVATILAGALAMAAIRRFSPVGVVDAGTREVHYAPSMSRATVFYWMHALRRVAFDEKTRLADRLDELLSYLRTRSLVVVLSDLHDPAALPAIKRMAQRHDLIVVQLQDPAERGALRAGLVPAVEAETGRTFVARGGTRWFGGDTAVHAQALKQASIDHLLLSTDRDVAAPFRRFLRDRGGLLRNTR